jgi:hypothetical protein
MDIDDKADPKIRKGRSKWKCGLNLIVVSFARRGRLHQQSFSRRRESTSQDNAKAPLQDWIPACAGMASYIRILNDSAVS